MLETHISAPIPRFTTLHKFGGANKFADQNNFYNILRVPLEGLEPPSQPRILPELAQDPLKINDLR
jgi:hypothetical protein